MDTEVILKNLKSAPGSNLTACWIRPVKTKKNYHGKEITKMTCAKIRCGIDYENILRVKLRREIGELPEKNAGLPWGEWKEFPYIITNNNQEYIRLYFASDRFAENGSKPVVSYWIDNAKINKKDYEQYFLASEFYDKTKMDCFTINARHIVYVGKKEPDEVNLTN